MTFDELVQDIRDAQTKIGLNRAFGSALWAARRLYTEEQGDIGQPEALERYAKRAAAVKAAHDERKAERQAAHPYRVNP